MEVAQLNKRRQANEIPFKVVYWLQGLSPVMEHEQFGTMYKGFALAEDLYGKYAAIIGTTDQLLNTSTEAPLRVLKIDKIPCRLSGNYNHFFTKGRKRRCRV